MILAIGIAYNYLVWLDWLSASYNSNLVVPFSRIEKSAGDNDMVHASSFYCLYSGVGWLADTFKNPTRVLGLGASHYWSPHLTLWASEVGGTFYFGPVRVFDVDYVIYLSRFNSYALITGQDFHLYFGGG